MGGSSEEFFPVTRPPGNRDVKGGPLGISIGTGGRRGRFVEKALFAVMRAIESGYSGEARGAVAFGSMPTPPIAEG